MTAICGTASRCDRHNIALHGYPCYACHQEWVRRSPRVVTLIRRRSTTPAQLTRARKDDAAAHTTYDGPHEVTVERAGTHGPVSRRFNALCTDGCGWSHYWLPSKTAAQQAATDHLAAGTVRT